MSDDKPKSSIGEDLVNVITLPIGVAIIGWIVGAMDIGIFGAIFAVIFVAILGVSINAIVEACRDALAANDPRRRE